jgi:hypothetical protein
MGTYIRYKKPNTETVTYRIDQKTKKELDEIDELYRRKYTRIKGKTVDIGIQIVSALIRKNGVEWLLENEGSLAKEIADHL